LPWLPRCAGPAGDESRGRTGPDAVVDVDDGEAGGARLEHRQECRLSLAAGSVTRRHRQPDHGRVDQPGHHSGQHAIHPGGDDQDVGTPFDDLDERLDQPVKAGHADVEHQPGLHACRLEHHPGLLRHREVGGAGGDDRHPPG